MTTLDLRGKKALVTGGTKGVGRGVVLGLARSGAQVMTCYRQEGEAVRSLERELKEIGGEHHVVRADLADPAQIRMLLEEASTHFGSLDVVVNNAATITHVPYAELTLEQWQQIVNTNITATHLVIQNSLPLLDAGSSVISISSKSIEVGIPLRAHYTATKSALIGLNRSLAKEFGSKGIRFNVVSLGMVHTEALDDLPADKRELMISRYSEKIALGRMADPAEVAGAVLWLASDLSQYVTGATVPVDGGIS